MKNETMMKRTKKFYYKSKKDTDSISIITLFIINKLFFMYNINYFNKKI